MAPYVGGWCVLIAHNGQYVIAWQWCDRESNAAWVALFRLLLPRMWWSPTVAPDNAQPVNPESLTDYDGLMIWGDADPDFLKRVGEKLAYRAWASRTWRATKMSCSRRNRRDRGCRTT